MTREHWDATYETKAHEETGWFELEPTISLELIEQCGVSPSERVVDVGGLGRARPPGQEAAAPGPVRFRGQGRPAQGHCVVSSRAHAALAGPRWPSVSFFIGWPSITRSCTSSQSLHSVPKRRSM